MEETLSLVVSGCKLARDLESNLPQLSNQPSFLSDSCHEIIRVFKSVIDRLNSQNPTSYPDMVFQESSEPRSLELDAEWLRSSYTKAMDILQSQFLADKNPSNKMGMTQSPELGLEIRASNSSVKVPELGITVMDYIGTVEGNTLSRSVGEFRAMEVSESGKSPMSQRSRKRKDGVDKRTVRIPAPRTGNTEIPPDDGFTWRKYGQKEILGSTFPRGYYRCTHKNFYGCEAKKQVQRLDDDPSTYEITYYGQHTCHMSSMVLQSVRPMGDVKEETLETTQPLLWRKDTNTLLESPVRMFMDFDLGGGASSSATVGPVHVADPKEVECPVVDLADAMFNSGSRSNSMDSIFPSMHDK